MKKIRFRTCIYLLALSLMVPAGGFSQDAGTAPPVFRQEELDQMLAPIALYPDSLLIQVLMASTYPLEVVQAARWLNQNPGLKGAKLAAALEQKPWDPSVKSLVNFPQVLAMLNERLDWTQNLGDAFLGQRDQVMATIQDLRVKAQAAGNLNTNSEQVVVVKEKTIVIEPASPEVLYVPAYNPTVVYGTWWYPSYPPYYYYPPGYTVAAASVISFGAGVACGVAWGYAWGSVNWTNHNVYVNPPQNVTINNNYYNTNVRQNNVNTNVNVNNRFNQANINAKNTVNSGQQGTTVWQHDPNHRRGVAYKDPNVQKQFGQTASAGAASRQNFRGFNPSGTTSHGNFPNQGKSLQGNTGQGQQTFNQRKSGTGLNQTGSSQQFKKSGTGSLQQQGSSAAHNRSSSGALQNLNRSGSEVKQQSNRGKTSRESLQTHFPGQSQSTQGRQLNQGSGFSNPGGGSFPKAGGGASGFPKAGGAAGGGNVQKFGGAAGGGNVQKFGGGGGGGGANFPKAGGGNPPAGGGAHTGGGGGGPKFGNPRN